MQSYYYVRLQNVNMLKSPKRVAEKILESENPYKLSKAENLAMSVEDEELRSEIFIYISSVDPYGSGLDITHFKNLTLSTMREVSVKGIGSFEELLEKCCENDVKVSEDILDPTHDGKTVGHNMFLVLKEKERIFGQMS